MYTIGPYILYSLNRGTSRSAFVCPLSETKDKQTVPILVLRYELVMSNDFIEAIL